MNWIYLIIIIIIVLIILFTTQTTESFTDVSDNILICPSCKTSDATCKDGGGQTYYSDSNCANPSQDKWGGLGCIADPNTNKATGCRYCGFGVFSQIPCPNSPIPSPATPITPVPTPQPQPITPVPTPQPQPNQCNRSGNYKVNLINECPVTVLAAAVGPTTVEPADGKSWVLKSGEKIRIDIPEEWECTAGKSTINGPRFWARTGCNYDVETNRANCEGGDCGNRFDCAKENLSKPNSSNSNTNAISSLAGSPPGSWAEFCFNCGDGMTYYDVSLVDGAHMSMDIKPINPQHDKHPGDPDDPFWCKSNLCKSGRDLRDPNNCPSNFILKNTDISSSNPNNPETNVACFSNCGKWAYEVGKLKPNTCDLGNTSRTPDEENICNNWRIYCCQSPSSGKACTNDGDCQYGEACWNGTCQCRAYYRKSCNVSDCTHPYCECNDKTNNYYPNIYNNNNNNTNIQMSNQLLQLKNRFQNIKNYDSNGTITQNINNKLVNKAVVIKDNKTNNEIKSKSCNPQDCPQGFSTQPIPKICQDHNACVGDDTFHQVCPQAYTWPNDPQTYDCDAKEYNITFCPGGTSVKMSDSKEGIISCSSLPKEYNYEKALQNCMGAIKNGDRYACASKNGLWACGLPNNSSCYAQGVLCKFDNNK